MYVLRMQSHQLNNITGRDDGNDVVRGICDDDDDGELIQLTRGVFAKNERIWLSNVKIIIDFRFRQIEIEENQISQSPILRRKY